MSKSNQTIYTFRRLGFVSQPNLHIGHFLVWLMALDGRYEQPDDLSEKALGEDLFDGESDPQHWNTGCGSMNPGED